MRDVFRSRISATGAKLASIGLLVGVGGLSSQATNAWAVPGDGLSRTLVPHGTHRVTVLAGAAQASRLVRGP